MSSISAVTFNSGSTITGTTQVGNLAIGSTPQDYSLDPGGLRWWSSADLTLGYVIAHVNLDGNQPNPEGIPGVKVGFWRTAFTDAAFIEKAEYVSKLYHTPETFTSATQANEWFFTNGYWTSYPNETPSSPTPTPTATITPTPTRTPSPTPTPSSTPVPTIQSFTTIGTTSWTAPAGVTSVEYLVVGGGGGGGNGYDTGGGGGGAGGMVRTGTLAVTPGNSYTVTVGSGGNGGPVNYPSNQNGAAGGNSVFSTITSLGGDSGNGSRTVQIAVGRGGSAQVSTTTAPTGGDGGGNAGSAVGGSGGGGGGATGNGGNGSASAGGTSGNGLTSSITGSSVIYGRGGVGARGNVQTTGANGLANRGTGGGGGGCNSGCGRAGGNGGSGIVILKYFA